MGFPLRPLHGHGQQTDNLPLNFTDIPCVGVRVLSMGVRPYGQKPVFFQGTLPTPGLRDESPWIGSGFRTGTE